MIFIHELKKSFGARRVLDGLNFEAMPGAITLLVGANGAGKTTALRSVAGLSDFEAGAISIAGHDLKTARHDALRQLSFLPQAPRFNPHLTVVQVAKFYAQLRGRTLGAVAAALEEWGLAEHARVATGKLSGGLRQRLALAVFALASAPVLVLGEPGLSLDPEWRRRLQHFITEKARRGRTVLVATHLLGEWESLVDRCLLIEHGRCTGEISPEHLRDGFFLREVQSRAEMPVKVSV